jgi:hypothetical protein
MPKRRADGGGGEAGRRKREGSVGFEKGRKRMEERRTDVR